MPTTGKIILNEDMTGYDGTVKLYSGTVKIGEKGSWFAGNTYVENATIDMQNNKIDNSYFKDLEIVKNLNLCIDVDMANKDMDKISSDSFTGEGKISVLKFNVLTDAKNTGEILFADDNLKDKVVLGTTKATSDLYAYNVNYNSSNGYVNFAVSGLTPVAIEGAVAGSVGGKITQTIVAEQAFMNMDTKNSLKKSAKSNRVLYASTADRIFESDSKIERGLWLRPYIVQETVKLDNFDVDTQNYGTLAGLDLAVAEDKMLSVYVGYTGSQQKYEEITADQTGFVAGVTGMMIKDKYFVGATLNAGISNVEAKNDDGKDKIDMNMFTFSAKAGYDIEAGKNWTIQPAMLVLAGNVATDGYTTSKGGKVDSCSTTSILIEPQVKAKLSLNSGWIPYAILGYAIDAGSKAEAKTPLVTEEVGNTDGYVEYGAGVQKDFNKTPWSVSGQFTGRSGGRSGFGVNLGVKYAF